MKRSTAAALVARGLCRLDDEGHLVAVDTAGRRDDARATIQGASDLGALARATELSGHVRGQAALVARLRLGRQAAADPLAPAVRQAFPLAAGAVRYNSSPGLS